MKRLATLSVLASVLAATSVQAALVTSHLDATAGGATVDASLGANEYGPGNSYVYAGGGGGFGGTLGGGALYMETDGTNLYIGFQAGNNLNDNVVIHLDTQAGGQTDASMNDTADPGRNLLSNLTRDVDDPFTNGLLPDFGVVIGPFGNVVFGLNAGNTPGHLSYINFDGSQTGNNPGLFRELSIPLATLGNPSQIDFFVSYGSDTNYMSNESMPSEAFNAGGNPGFDNNGTNQPLSHGNYHQLQIPEPGSLALLGLAAVTGLARRSRR